MIKITDIIIWTAALVIIVVVDYYHTVGQSFVSSAVPLFIFQICMIIDAKYKKEHGKGIIESVMDFFKKDDNPQ